MVAKKAKTAVKKGKAPVKKGKSSSPQLADVSEADILKDLTWKVIEQHNLPKGAVTRLLKENNIDERVIEEVVHRLVPYGHTPVER